MVSPLFRFTGGVNNHTLASPVPVLSVQYQPAVILELAAPEYAVKFPASWYHILLLFGLLLFNENHPPFVNRSKQSSNPSLMMYCAFEKEVAHTNAPRSNIFFIDSI